VLPHVAGAVRQDVRHDGRVGRAGGGDGAEFFSQRWDADSDWPAKLALIGERYGFAPSALLRLDDQDIAFWLGTLQALADKRAV